MRGTCKEDDCAGQAYGRGWCSKHYQRWRRNGTPDTIRTRGTCARDDCDQVTASRGLCSKHYQRIRHQETDPCVIEGCDRLSVGRGWCRMHYLRWWRNGDPLVGAQPPPSYDSTHAKLRRDRGPAKDYPCAEGCGKQAEHWSYDGRDPDQKWTPWRDGSGRLMPYSTKQEHYHPVCVKCHYRINRERPTREQR